MDSGAIFMYRALVVDDTSAEVECIQFLIRKFGLELEVCTASNGRDALALLEKGPFDILMTDIKMPLMDGLALAREARRLDASIRIVLFSGYNEFEYAKTAISIGVTDYLMKPIDPDTFLQTMRSVILSIENVRKTRRESAIVHRHMIWMLLNQNEGEPGNFDLPSSYESMMMLEFACDFFGSSDDGFEPLLRRAIQAPFDFVVLYPVRALLLFHTNAETKNADMQEVRRQVLTLTEDRYGYRLTIGFEQIDDMQNFQAIYRRLEAQAEHSPAFERRAPDGQALDKVMEFVRQGDIAHVREKLGALISLAEAERWPESYVKYALVRVTLELMQLAGEQGCEADVVRRIFQHAGNQEALECIDRLCTDVEARENKLGNRNVEAIKQYIYQNYAKSLGLGELAEMFYFSPSYLCHIFKRETGCNLVKFINDYRMKKAQEMLMDTPIKVNAIAKSVGYKSASYFCQRFRDYYGVSPEQFRQGFPVGR